jgi:hypothetical protein
MSRIDELPPDQSAALSLLLRQRKTYAEVATLLAISDRAVHDRAHAALAMLAPRRARELTPEQRLQIGDYLLDQQTGVAERIRNRAYLASSEPANAWARELAAQLAPLAGPGAPLTDIPAPPATGSPTTHAASPSATNEPERVADLSPATSAAAAASGSGPFGSGGSGAFGAGTPAGAARSSRTAGAVLLAVIAAVVIVVVVLLTSGGSSHNGKGTTTSASTTTAQGKGKSKGPKVEDQITLKASHAGNKAIAVVYVLSEGGKRAFFIAAQNLPETKHFYYAIWLYNSPTHFLALSRSPPVGSNHSLAGGSALPAGASGYHEILLTEETTEKPAQPGHVVMRGPFKVG